MIVGIRTYPIEYLLNSLFSQRSYDDKKIIIENGRPCPDLPDLREEWKDDNKKYVRTFNRSQYESHR